MVDEDFGDAFKQFQQNQSVDWKNKGNDYFKVGDYENAKNCYLKAIELNPDYKDGWNNLSLTHYKIGNLDEAKKCKAQMDDINVQIIHQNAIPQIPKSQKPNNRRNFTIYCSFIAIAIVISMAWISYLPLMTAKYSTGKSDYVSSPTQMPIPQNTISSTYDKGPTQTDINLNEELSQDSIRGLLMSMDTSNSLSVNGFNQNPDSPFYLSISSIQISNDSNDDLKNVKIVYFVPNVWDEKNFMAGSTATDSSIFENLLKNPKIGKITAVSTLKMADKYGNENIENGLSVTMSKSTANRINWENIMAIGDYRRLLNVADSSTINPSIRAGL